MSAFNHSGLEVYTLAPAFIDECLPGFNGAKAAWPQVWLASAHNDAASLNVACFQLGKSDFEKPRK